MESVDSVRESLSVTFGFCRRFSPTLSPRTLFSFGAFVSCRIHRLAIFIRRKRMAAVRPPLLQTCLLQSSSLLPHVYRRGIALLRHDAVSFLFFPPAALRMVSCGCFSLAAAFYFPISQPRRSMRRRALSLLKLFLSLIYSYRRPLRKQEFNSYATFLSWRPC